MWRVYHDFLLFNRIFCVSSTSNGILFGFRGNDCYLFTDLFASIGKVDELALLEDLLFSFVFAQLTKLWIVYVFKRDHVLLTLLI